MSLAARVGDLHVCTLVSGPMAHVGGAITGPGVATVTIGTGIAACAGDLAPCAGSIPNAVLMGSPTVLIGVRPAARLGDATIHGGRIVLGCPTVDIGDGGGGALQEASATASPFVRL